MKYEIRAVKLEGDNYVPCAADDPEAVWGLYVIRAGGLPRHVSDHPTREEAEAEREKIAGGETDPWG